MVIYTNHKPLILATQWNWSRFIEKETRQLDYLSQFDLEFRHKPGRENVVADTFSRANVSSLHLKTILNLIHSAAKQKKCCLRKRDSDPHLVESPLDTTGTTMLVHISTDKTRPIVAELLSRQIFDRIHSLSHHGVWTSIMVIVDHNARSGMKKDKRNWVQGCTLCQNAKCQRHNKSPVGTFNTPVNFASSLRLSWTITYTDRFTR